MHLRAHRSFYPTVRPMPGEHPGRSSGAALRHWSEVNATLGHFVDPDAAAPDAGATWCHVVEDPQAATAQSDEDRATGG